MLRGCVDERLLPVSLPLTCITVNVHVHFVLANEIHVVVVVVIVVVVHLIFKAFLVSHASHSSIGPKVYVKLYFLFSETFTLQHVSDCIRFFSISVFDHSIRSDLSTSIALNFLAFFLSKRRFIH